MYYIIKYCNYKNTYIHLCICELQTSLVMKEDKEKGKLQMQKLIHQKNRSTKWTQPICRRIL